MSVRGLLVLLAWTAAAPPAAAVELNTADQADLELVKGIGPEVSRRLVEAREGRPFDDWHDLMKRVKGIGKPTARRWSCAGVTVQGQPYPAEPPASSAVACSR
jgi:competence protein ComEA